MYAGSWQEDPWPSTTPRDHWDNGAWSDHGAGQRTKSPGRLRSPRSRGREGKGKDKAKGKAKEKPQVESQPDGARVPHLDAVPTPPTLPALTLPTSSASSTQETAGSEAQAKLDALINSLVSAKETLPPAVLQALGEHTTSHTMQESKVLHRAVSAKTTARKELAKIRTARATYLTAWDSYLTQLVGVLESQFKDQDAMLLKYQEAEDRWQQQLREAAATLSKLSVDKQDREDAGDVEEADMDTDTAMDEMISACVKDVQERSRQRREQLQLLLRGAREVDGTPAPIKRESSRTPRRSNKDGTAVTGPEVHCISDSPPGHAQ